MVGEKVGPVGVVVLLGSGVEGQMCPSLCEYPGVEVIEYNPEETYELIERLKAIWSECINTPPRKLFLYVHHQVLVQNIRLVSGLTHFVDTCERCMSANSIEITTYGMPFGTQGWLYSPLGGHTYVNARGDESDARIVDELQAHLVTLGSKKAGLSA